jgi:anti-anti-sigma factor
MHITVEPNENHAILHLRGEFDTYYCPLLQEEIDGVLRAGTKNVVLNLRMVRFINSTALGAIIKASKGLTQKGGRLVISRPSTFCRDIIEKVGLDRVVPVFETDEAAAESLVTQSPKKPAEAAAQGKEEPAALLFTLVDQERLSHFISKKKDWVPPGLDFGAQWSGTGRMASLDEKGLRFAWNGGSTGLSPFDMGQMLSVGTRLMVKFRLPLLRRGYCEAQVEVTLLEERPDGVKVGAVFTEIDTETRDAVRQYARDMAFLRDELRKATDR